MRIRTLLTDVSEAVSVCVPKKSVDLSKLTAVKCRNSNENSNIVFGNDIRFVGR